MKAFMKALIEKLNDGGPFFTYVIMALILVIIGLFVKALLDKEYNGKLKSLIASLGWFALAWGYMGRTFGLIMAFDKIAVAGDIAPSYLAGGLKMALIGSLCGLTAFIIARLGIIILTTLQKKEKTG